MLWSFAYAALCRILQLLLFAEENRRRCLQIAGTTFEVTANLDDDQRLGEVFVHFGKHGSLGNALLSSFSELLSLALAHGMPLEEFVRTFVNSRFEPAGMTDDPDILRTTSPMDYLARRLARDFLPTHQQNPAQCQRLPQHELTVLFGMSNVP
jgi:hypothetical protein